MCSLGGSACVIIYSCCQQGLAPMLTFQVNPQEGLLQGPAQPLITVPTPNLEELGPGPGQGFFENQTV